MCTHYSHTIDGVNGFRLLSAHIICACVYAILRSLHSSRISVSKEVYVVCNWKRGKDNKQNGVRKQEGERKNIISEVMLIVISN